MSDAKKMNAQKPPAQPEAVASKCPVEKCGKGSTRMHFCTEHFDWFKAGLINKRGEKPSDFDKKYMSYLRKNVKSA